MQKIDALKIIVLVTLALGFAVFLNPLFTFDLRDVYENNNYQKPEVLWKSEEGLLYMRYSEYVDDNGDISLLFNHYCIFHFLNFYSGEKSGLYQRFSVYEDNEVESIFLSPEIFAISAICIIGIFLPIMLYFYYKGFLLYGEKKTKYFLYIGIMLSVLTTIFPIYLYYLYNLIDGAQIGFFNNLKIGYGYYLLVTTTILFFIIHFIQSRFLNLEKESNIIRNEESI